MEFHRKHQLMSIVSVAAVHLIVCGDNTTTECTNVA